MSTTLVRYTKGTAALGQLSKIRAPVKSVMSVNRAESQQQVRGLYKQWVRSIPDIISIYRLPFTEAQIKSKIRQEFYKNSHIRDIRVIDLLIIKSQMDLQETLEHWKQTCHMMEFFGKPTDIQRPVSFIGKFLTQRH